MRTAAGAIFAALAVLATFAAAALAQPHGGGSHRGDGRRSLARLGDARKLGAVACGTRARRARASRRRVSRRFCAGSPAPAPEQHPLYWGATIGPQLTGTQAPWDMNAVAKFESTARKPVSLIQFFQPFSNCSTSPCTFYPFPSAPLENVRRHGSIPVLAWASQSIPGSLDQSDYQLSDVISGRYDEDIREFATAAAAWGHPFFLRFNWEMNGDWFPWSESANGNAPGEYVAAWRHVHDIFPSVGATNATWAWCPYVDPQGTMQDLASLYPGDEYVDWTCLDGYNWGPAKGGWKSFDQLYSSTYHQITDTIAPSKPMLIGEIGSTEAGGSKAAWIADALARIPEDYPAIRGLLWFDTVADNMDWPIETSSSASSAFAEGVQDPAYRGNDYAELSAPQVLPPT
jgi:hypothetical protein